MCDNSDNNKPNEEKPENNNNNENEVIIKEDINDNNHIKDEDESQDIKTSDLVISVPILESESEKRCTSASNAGESEYESADDEEVNQNDTNSIEDNVIEDNVIEDNVIEDNVIEDKVESQEIESSNQTIDNPIDEFCDNNNEVTKNDSKENESLLSNEQLINDKTLNNTTIVCEESVDKSFVDNCESDPIEKSNELVIDSSEERNVDSIETNEEIKEVLNDSKDEVINNNNEIKISDDSKEVLNEDIVENSNKEMSQEDNYEIEATNGDDFDEELIYEEGGREGMAELDDDDEYEDIEDSDECSDESERNDENEDDLRHQELAEKGNEEDIDAERQQGDGEESNDSQQIAKDKAKDHDEDKRNPQYIPKRGPFYEHDDRMSETAVIEEPAVEEETPPKPIVIAKKPVPIEDPKKKIRKKLWNESDRWGHDLFNENEQIPKSKDELVDIYGYDIRNEDDPPKARRRRRYGRGPNKYTRQWQDENAYGKAMPPNIEHNRPFRNDNNDRNERNVNSRNDRSANERIDRERQPIRKERIRTDRKERFSNDLSLKKAVVKSNDKPVNDKKKFESEDKVMKRVQPFSTDEFPELPNNDLRKKITSNTSSQHQEVWKSRNSSEVEDKHEKEFKTEPMKIIEAIENSNRSPNEGNAPNIVRTQTFENSKYSQRRSSANYDYEEEDRKGVRGRSRPNNESTGRAIRKTNNNLNYSNYNQGREVPTDNYRNRSMGRSERSYHEESNRNIERYYEEDTYRSQREGSNYVSEANTALQKLTIEDKTSAMSRNNESEVPRTKRYSSLRQQQQRVMPENIPNISTNSQLTQGSDGRNLSAHQYYDSHPIQTAPYFPEPSAPRNTYPTYMSTNTTESPPQTHPSNYLPQQLTQRYITQATVPPTPESSRYLPPNVSPNVVTASVPTAMPSIPQTGPPLPPTVMSAVAPPPPPGATYIPSFPSGYPQYPPPTHPVPPGYPGHVPQQPQQPTALQMAELYRGGVTYYDTQSQQQHTIRQIPQRRPKAAIPIISPSQGRDDPNASGDQGYGDGDKSYVSVNS